MEKNRSQFTPGAGNAGTKNPYTQSFGSEAIPGDTWNAGFNSTTGQFPFLQDSVPFNNTLCYDLYEEAESLVVEVPFPGLSPETLSVVQENRWLRIWGETGNVSHPNRTSPQQRKVIVNQIPKGIFDQTIMLPCEVSDAVANFTNGILTIKLKKAVGTNAHKVPVQFK